MSIIRSIPDPFPTFDDLPLDKSGPPGNAWGLFGPGDQLGMLNLLTPETVRAAAKEEIREGIRISLDWPLNKPAFPTFAREKFHHEIQNKSPQPGVSMNDDMVCFNTQSSTRTSELSFQVLCPVRDQEAEKVFWGVICRNRQQWDGFRHYGYQKAKKYFNGYTQADFENGGMALGIHSWVERGGIVGRGVLLDWATWAKENGIPVLPFQTGVVEVSHLKAIISEQKITTQPGDILFIRSGFAEAYNKLDIAEQEAFPDRQPSGLLGLEASRESLRWLWENRFAAAAGDSPSFERGPANGPYNDPDVTMHQWMLGGWGMPIGEMFDLEVLAQECKRLERHTFFLSSMPLHVPGGVASPPNAVAMLL